MRKGKSWPDMEIKPSAHIKTLFSRDDYRAATPSQASSNEIEAVNTALDMESKSVNFYEAQMKSGGYASETRFYEALADQERGHRLALLDYLEFMQDPVSYFARLEHHSLDGV
jgi:rubrerythrin